MKSKVSIHEGFCSDYKNNFVEIQDINQEIKNNLSQLV